MQRNFFILFVGIATLKILNGNRGQVIYHFKDLLILCNNSLSFYYLSECFFRNRTRKFQVSKKFYMQRYCVYIYIYTQKQKQIRNIRIYILGVINTLSPADVSEELIITRSNVSRLIIFTSCILIQKIFT